METNRELTLKQNKVLSFIEERINSGIPPTIREIAGELGFSSTGTVRDYLKALEKKGYLRRTNNKSRAIELIGSIPAGNPDSAFEDIQDHIELEKIFPVSGRKNDIFALKIKGESMVEAGIMDGDIAIIRKQQTAENNDIVAALLENNEVTLKRLRRENDKFFLEAANTKYQPIHKDFTVIGRLIGILRKYS